MYHTPILIPAELARDAERALTQTLNYTDGEHGKGQYGYFTRGAGWAGSTLERLRTTVAVAWGLKSTSVEMENGWHKVPVGDVQKLVKTFEFTDYHRALGFVYVVARLATDHDHHPEILLEYNRVTIWWWTHDTRGVEDRDVELAGKVEAEYRRVQP